MSKTVRVPMRKVEKYVATTNEAGNQLQFSNTPSVHRAIELKQTWDEVHKHKVRAEDRHICGYNTACL